MTNAQFRSTHGTKVIFSSGIHMEGYDFFTLEPKVLAVLGLNPDDLQKDQAKINSADKAWLASHATEAQALYDQRMKDFEAQEKYKAEQERQAAIIRRQQWEDGLKSQAVENERIKAEAAMKQAQTPSQIIIQQTQVAH